MPVIRHPASTAKTVLFELQTYLDATEKNSFLYEEKNFVKRTDIIDFIGFQVMDQIEELLQKATSSDKLFLLKDRAEKIKSDLEEINNNLYQRIQTKIRAGNYTGNEFKNLIHEWFDLKSNPEYLSEEPGYDNLDIFINGLFPLQSMPHQTKDLEPDMVYYQKTPARIVFELVGKTQFTKEDVFFDLGSGLGQPAILVNLLAGVPTWGVEFEPAFCQYAEHCAKELRLSNVHFIHADARNADYSVGTIFFMFTPFRGEILQDVLEMLRKESLKRKINLISYGPCTAELALQSWLHFTNPNENMYRLSFFTSI